MTLGSRPHESSERGRERNEHHTHQPDRLRTEHMLIVSPRPAVRTGLVGVLRDGGFSAEAVGDLAQAGRCLSNGNAGGADAVMVVIDARPVERGAPCAPERAWDRGALAQIARRVPALLVIADGERRDALQSVVATCPRGLLLERLDPLSVLVCAEMLVDGRVPPALQGDAGPESGADAARPEDESPPPPVEPAELAGAPGRRAAPPRTAPKPTDS